MINDQTTVRSVPGDSQQSDVLQVSASPLPPGAPRTSEVQDLGNAIDRHANSADSRPLKRIEEQMALVAEGTPRRGIDNKDSVQLNEEDGTLGMPRPSRLL